MNVASRKLEEHLITCSACHGPSTWCPEAQRWMACIRGSGPTDTHGTRAALQRAGRNAPTLFQEVERLGPAAQRELRDLVRGLTEDRDRERSLRKQGRVF